MTMFLYSIFDEVAGEYGPVFEAVKHEVAIRSFKSLVKNFDDHTDYKLFCIGAFDHDEGFINDNAPELINTEFNSEVVEK